MGGPRRYSFVSAGLVLGEDDRGAESKRNERNESGEKREREGEREEEKDTRPSRSHVAD